MESGRARAIFDRWMIAPILRKYKEFGAK